MRATSIDRAITNPNEDRLGLNQFADDIARTLIADDGNSSRGIVLGLEGSWGSGKTSVLNLVEARLRARVKSIVLVRFDPWLISKRDDLIASFLRELTKAVGAGDQGSERVRKTTSTLLDYGKILAPSANYFVPALGEAIGSVLEALGKGITHFQDLAEVPGLTKMRSKVKDELAELGRPIVVLIDELDRIEDAEVRTVAQLVRSVLDFEGISYLLAYDPERVAEALGGGRNEMKRGEAYLEKIVQQRLPLPAQLPTALQKMLSADFRALVPESILNVSSQDSNKWLSTVVDAAIPSVVKNLRDIHRSLASFSVLEPMFRYEIDPVDLVGWSMLLAKSPEVSRRLCADLSTIFDPDVSDGEALLRVYFEAPYKRRISGRIFENWPDGPSKTLAKLLLLRQHSGGEPSEMYLPANSIAYGDILINVLTYGSHELRFPVANVLEAIAQGYICFRNAAVDAWTSNRFAQFLCALRFAFPHAEWSIRNDIPSWLVDLAEDDAAFGQSLGMRKRHRWITISFVFILNCREVTSTAKYILDDLIESINKHRVVLASHLIALRLNQIGTEFGEDGLGPFSPDEIDTFCNHYGTWARERAKKNALVHSLRDYTQFRTLRRMGILDEELLASISAEIKNQAALDHLVQLFYGDEEILDDNLSFYVQDIAALRDKLILRAQDHREKMPDDLELAIDNIKRYMLFRNMT